MAAVCPIDGLPPELLMEILSRLRWRQQLRVRRVSRRWKAAVDACLARRRELHVVQWGGTRDVETLVRLLQRTPVLPAMRRRTPAMHLWKFQGGRFRTCRLERPSD